MTSFYVTSFICQVHVCICNKFYMTSFIYWCERVYFDNLSASDVIVQRTTRALANHIKCSDYFDKFSLSTHTDEQNLYFDNFFCDKCTYSKLTKASMLAFEQVHLS
jgi:hypothetical protein